jgi:hypothetical protein
LPCNALRNVHSQTICEEILDYANKLVFSGIEKGARVRVHEVFAIPMERFFAVFRHNLP